MRATLNFSLPDDADEFDAALQGRTALSLLWEIDNHCRSVVKYMDSTDAEQRLANDIRTMISESDLSID